MESKWTDDRIKQNLSNFQQNKPAITNFPASDTLHLQYDLNDESAVREKWPIYNN